MTLEIFDRSGDNVTAFVSEYPMAMTKCWMCIFRQKNYSLNLFNIVVLHSYSGSICDWILLCLLLWLCLLDALLTDLQTSGPSNSAQQYSSDHGFLGNVRSTDNEVS